MLSRVAEQIFWLSRYIERTVAVSRLLDATLHVGLDGHEEDELRHWSPLLGAELADPLAVREMDPATVRYKLTFDPQHPTSVVACIRNARAAAREVRESISSEMWERLNTLYLLVLEPALRRQADENPTALFKRIREDAQAFQGLADSTLVHGEEWHFFCLGMYLERASNVARVLTLESHLLTLSPALSHEDETVRWLAILRSCGSAEAYARYYSLRVEPARVIEFVLLNPLFPQSIRFSLNAAWLALSAIAALHAREEENPALRVLGRLRASVEHTAVDENLESGLDEFLGTVQQLSSQVTEHVKNMYLRDLDARDRLMPVTRAAMIMAAQQQQQ